MSWWELPPADTGKVTEQYPPSPPLATPLTHTYIQQPRTASSIQSPPASLCAPHLTHSLATTPTAAIPLRSAQRSPFSLSPPTPRHHPIPPLPPPPPLAPCLSIFKFSRWPFPLVRTNHRNKSVQCKNTQTKPRFSRFPYEYVLHCGVFYGLWT